MFKITKYISTICMTMLIISGVTAQNSYAEGKLSIYHWFEYIPQELLDKFSKEHDVEVTMDTYDSNESMLASLKAGGIGSYDVAVPGDYMVKIMGQQNLLDTFKKSELKNFKNIEEQWVDVDFDKGRKSSIPYQWGSTSFSVNRDAFKGDINTTDILFDPPSELAGKINMLDSQGEVMLMATLHLGIEQCSTDKSKLKKLNSLLEGSKKHWASFGSDIAKDVLTSGDALAGMIYNGFSAKGREEGANIEYAYPKQGFIAWMDNVVLLKDAPNRGNALKFMDFLLEPENMATVTNFAQYSAGVKGVKKFLTKQLQENPENNPPKSAKGVFIETCDENTQKFYDNMWTNLKK